MNKIDPVRVATVSRPGRPVHRLAGPLLLVALAVLLLLCVATVFVIALSEGDRAPEAAPRWTMPATPPPAVPPPSDPAALMRYTPAQAEAANALIPVSRAVNPAASSFRAVLPPDAWGREVRCLTAAAYYEAVGEGDDGMRAVAQVVLNRVHHPAFPHNVCGVVLQGAERSTGCQFSFTCDGSLGRPPNPVGWARATRLAIAALSGAVYAPVGLATHYHTRWVLPYWASSLEKNAIVGNHIFYRWAGGWGASGAFGARYSVGDGAMPGELSPIAGVPAPQTAGDQAGVAPTASGGRAVLGTNVPDAPLTPPRPVLTGERWVIGAPAPAGTR